MRARASPALPAALLAALLALHVTPLAAAHQGGGHDLPHVNPQGGRLPPGEVETYNLSFAESPTGEFEAGWVFVLNAILYEGEHAPEATLLLRNQTLATWRIQPGQVTQRFTTLMPETSLYQLRIRNDGNSTVNVGMFYDQSCNCAAKPIPIEVPKGLVVFNTDPQKGATWKATFPEPPVHRLQVTLAERTDPQSRWPQDFRVLQTSTEPVVRDVGAGPVRLHEVTWTAAQTQRYYFFVASVAQDLARFNPQNPVPGVMVTPLFEQLAAAPKPAPGPEGLAVLAALGALALAVRRRA